MGRSSKLHKAAHLINILKATRAHHPNFTLLLGAGASVESGIRSGAQMVTLWRREFQTIHDLDPEKQSWFGSTDEYSILFETLYDQASQRREFIEECVEKGSPSWGYIYLVDLLHHGSFNTVFTTNFDDLLNEACYLFSTDVRPIVCAHDSSLGSLRITAKRPKIIKLHGDFLFDSIKNTVRELESLEHNTREKFKQFATEYGMIVVGYGGNDRSIMDTLDALLRNESNFPHGIYWCTRESKELAPQVDQLRRFPKFHVVQIDGFDAFFAEIYSSLGFGLHPVFENPYKVLSKRLSSLLSRLRIPASRGPLHPKLADDVLRLGNFIEKQATNDPELKSPSQLLAWIESHRGNDTKAITIMIKYFQELKLTRSDWEVVEALNLTFRMLTEHWDEDQALQLFTALESLHEKNPVVSQLICSMPKEYSIEFMSLKRWDWALRLLELQRSAIMNANATITQEYFILNVVQVKRHTKKQLTATDREKLQAIAIGSKSVLSRFGSKILLKKFPEAVTEITGNFKEGHVEDVDLGYILGWPICSLLPEADLNSLKNLVVKTEGDSGVHDLDI